MLITFHAGHQPPSPGPPYYHPIPLPSFNGNTVSGDVHNASDVREHDLSGNPFHAQQYFSPASSANATRNMYIPSDNYLSASLGRDGNVLRSWEASEPDQNLSFPNPVERGPGFNGPIASLSAAGMPVAFPIYSDTVASPNANPDGLSSWHQTSDRSLAAPDPRFANVYDLSSHAVHDWQGDCSEGFSPIRFPNTPATHTMYPKQGSPQNLMTGGAEYWHHGKIQNHGAADVTVGAGYDPSDMSEVNSVPGDHSQSSILHQGVAILPLNEDWQGPRVEP